MSSFRVRSTVVAVLLALLALAAGVVAQTAAGAENEPAEDEIFDALSSETAAAREAAFERLVRLEELDESAVARELATADARSRPLLLELIGRRRLTGLSARVVALATSADAPTVEAALRALVLLGEESVRSALAAFDKAVDGRHAYSAVRLQALNRQHVVEQIVVARWRRKGGSYRGRYAELEKHGWYVQPVLLAMLFDIPLEDRFLVLTEIKDERLRLAARRATLYDLANSPRRGYRTFAPLPVQIREDSLFELAQQAFRDVADMDLVGDILEQTALDLLNADRMSGWQLRQFEKAMAEGMAAVLYAHGRTELLAKQERDLRAEVTVLRRHYLSGNERALSTLARRAQELAGTLHLMERYEEAADWYAEVNRYNLELSGERSAIVSYNRACALACAGKTDAALDQLDDALGLDTSDLTREWVAEDGDLIPLHDDPRFAAILDRRFATK